MRQEEEVATARNRLTHISDSGLEFSCVVWRLP
jgi:hypothetical protein